MPKVRPFIARAAAAAAARHRRSRTTTSSCARRPGSTACSATAVDAPGSDPAPRHPPRTQARVAHLPARHDAGHDRVERIRRRGAGGRLDVHGPGGRRQHHRPGGSATQATIQVDIANGAGAPPVWTGPCSQCRGQAPNHVEEVEGAPPAPEAISAPAAPAVASAVPWWRRRGRARRHDGRRWHGRRRGAAGEDAGAGEAGTPRTGPTARAAAAARSIRRRGRGGGSVIAALASSRSRWRGDGAWRVTDHAGNRGRVSRACLRPGDRGRGAKIAADTAADTAGDVRRLEMSARRPWRSRAGTAASCCSISRSRRKRRVLARLSERQSDLRVVDRLQAQVFLFERAKDRLSVNLWTNLYLELTNSDTTTKQREFLMGSDLSFGRAMRARCRARWLQDER